MDIRTPRIFEHHGHLDIIDILTSRIFGHNGYLDIMDIWTSYLEFVDILGEHRFPGNPQNDTFKALALQITGGHFFIFYASTSLFPQVIFGFWLTIP